MTINFVISLDPTLLRLLNTFSIDYASRFTSLETKIMASVDDLKNLIVTRIAALQAKEADEHTQVMAAIDALKAAVLNAVPDEMMTEVAGLFDAAETGVADIFTPDA